MIEKAAVDSYNSSLGEELKEGKMFQYEINESKYTLGQLTEHAKMLTQIENKELQKLIFEKIIKFQDIFKKMISAIKKDIELENFPDFNMQKEEKRKINYELYGLEHHIGQDIHTLQEFEIGYATKLKIWEDKKRKKGTKKDLIQKEEEEICALEDFNNTGNDIIRTLKEHRTNFKEEKEIIGKLIHLIERIKQNLKRIIKICRKEEKVAKAA